MAKNAFARVLTDIPSHGLKAGQLLEASPALIKALTAVGEVDDHKDAVSYARETGAAPVRSCIEVAAEKREAELAALRVRIAELEDLTAKAADEPTKQALQGELTKHQADLASLLAA